MLRKDYKHSFFIVKNTGKDSRSKLLSLIGSKMSVEVKNVTIAKDENNKPSLLYAGKTFGTLSIAHTKALLVGLFSKSSYRIGVDIENLITKEDTIHGFLTENELHYARNTNECFNKVATLIWVYKEAFVKALGSGFISHPNTICVSDIINKKTGEQGVVKYKNKLHVVQVLVKEQHTSYCIAAIAIVE